MRRTLWLGAGLALTGIGFLGALLPVLPTTVFLIGALYCFTRSSPALERWLLSHPSFGPVLRAWRSHGSVPRRAKWLASTMMAVSVAGMVLTAPPAVTAGVGAMLLGVATWLWARPELVSGNPR